MDDISPAKADLLFGKYNEDDQAVNSDAESSDSGGAYVYPEVLASFPVQPKPDEFHDTSLDDYIPCFVKKIPGMKPFLMDFKVSSRNKTTNNSARQRDFRPNGGSFCDFNNSHSASGTTSSYARQQEGSFRDFRTNEGSFREFNNSYSTSNTTSSYARQRDFGTNEGSFHDFNNSYSNTSSNTTDYPRQRDFGTNGGSDRNFNNPYTHSTTSGTSNYGAQRDLRINDGSFRDFNNSDSRAGNSDFLSNRGSWAFNPEEIRSTSYDQVRGPNHGNNNYRNNYGNNYRNNYGNNNYRNNYGNNNYRNNNYGNNNYRNNTHWNNNSHSNNSQRNNNFSNKPYKNNNYINHSNVNKDILIRGPRKAKGQEITPVQQNEQFNKKDFVVNYEKARFFMIKSFSENDVYNSVKYSVWSSTLYGNKKLDSVYRGEINEEGLSENCPIFLFFSVNSSGQFVGLAEMTGLVDFEKKMDFWQQDRWNGFFPVKWHIIKDIPNFKFRDITLENNENKVVTFSRDTQEILMPQGLKMLEIFKEFEAETSLLQDFEFYEEKEMERWEKENDRNNDDLSMEFLEEEIRRMSFQGPNRYY